MPDAKPEIAKLAAVLLTLLLVLPMLVTVPVAILFVFQFVLIYRQTPS
jgi:hypothetical protein